MTMTRLASEGLSTKPMCGTRQCGKGNSNICTVTVLLTDGHLRKMIENHLLQENELNDQSKVAQMVQQLVNASLGYADRPWHDWDKWAQGLE
jgi:hypothetical protein